LKNIFEKLKSEHYFPISINTCARSPRQTGCIFFYFFVLQSLTPAVSQPGRQSDAEMRKLLHHLNFPSLESITIVALNGKKEILYIVFYSMSTLYDSDNKNMKNII
jgi:hypothetical protein